MALNKEEVIDFLSNMSVMEIARRLGISKKAVERNLTSARKRLKRFRAV